MKYLKQVTYVLLLIGGLNWGVYGVSEYNFVDALFGSIPMIASIIYVLVGLSALYIIFSRFNLCSCAQCACSTNTCSCDIIKECECKKKSGDIKS